MKKFFLIAAMILMAVTANAQDKKFYLGGSVEFGYVNDANVAIVPEFGCSLNDKWGIGLSAGYMYMGTSNGLIAPYSRYTFTKAGICEFFADGQFDIRLGDSCAQFGIGIRPGIAVNVKPNLAIVARANAVSLSFGDMPTSFSLLGGSGNLAHPMALDLGFYVKF